MKATTSEVESMSTVNEWVRKLFRTVGAQACTITTLVEIMILEEMRKGHDRLCSTVILCKRAN